MDTDFNRTGSSHPRDTMLDRILNQRLQEQVRNHAIQNLIVKLDLSDEAVLKSDSLDVEVHLKKLNLAPKRNFRDIFRRQRQSQQVAKRTDHLLSGTWIVADECRDGMQRIKKKM